MQVVVGKILKGINKTDTIKSIKMKKNKNTFWTKEIIEGLKQAEMEIENGEGIPAEEVLKQWREQYRY